MMKFAPLKIQYCHIKFLKASYLYVFNKKNI